MSDTYVPNTEKDIYRVKYQNVLDLNADDAVHIGDVVLYCNVHSNNFNSARFAIEAPQDVCIMRLELFANNIQSYDHIINLEFGDKVIIGNNELVLTALPIGRGKVKIGLVSANEEMVVEKSFFNSDNSASSEAVPKS